MMVAIVYLKMFTVFSSIPFIIGNDNKRKKAAAAELEKITGDGEQFINKIYNGEKMSENPGVLMFTAPYKLCEGGCNGSDNVNIAMQFPLFIGRKGRDAYRRIFRRDFEVLHDMKDAAPFKQRTSTVPTTQSPCIILKLKLIPRTEPPTTTTTTTSTTTTTTSTTTTTTTTEATTIGCPYFPPGMCLKRKKHKTTHAATETEDLALSLDFIDEQPTTHPIVTRAVENRDTTPGDLENRSVNEVLVLRNENDESYLEDFSDGYNLYNYGYPRIKKDENINPNPTIFYG